MFPLHTSSRAWVAGLLAALMVVTPAAYALDGHDASKLYSLILADSADGAIGPMVEIDKNRLYQVLDDEIPAIRHGELRVVAGRDLTRQAIYNWVAQVPVGPNDTLFVYFTGHGAYARNRGQILRLADGTMIDRNELVNAMMARRARLTILITDACSNIIDAKVRLLMSRAEGLDHDVCRYLFFRHRGVVNVHAASPGEESIAMRDEGSLFTKALLDQLTSPNSAFKRTPITWGEVLVNAAEETADRFKRERAQNRDFRLLFPNQTSQTAHIIATGQVVPVPLQKSPYRLGILGEDAGGQGVRIRSVFENSPAEWAGIRPGEILYRIETGRIEPTVTPIRDIQDVNRNFWVSESALRPEVHRFYFSNPNEGISRVVKVRIRDISAREGTQP